MFSRAARRCCIAAAGTGGVLMLGLHTPAYSLQQPRAAVARMALPAAPDFSFGVIADVQWADAPDGSNFAKTVLRCYRGAFTQLTKAVDFWNTLPLPPSYIAQLGDLIDGINQKSNLDQSERALGMAVAELARAPAPSVNLVGNHELYNFNRAELAAAAWMRHGDKEFYSFAPAAGWRVLVLDAYQIGLIGYGHDLDDPRRKEAERLLAEKNPNVEPVGKGVSPDSPEARLGARGADWFANGKKSMWVPFNGGFGGEQLAWMRSELAAAAKANERVIVMSHVILEPGACDGITTVWDYEEALELIRSDEAGGCVVAVLCGHDHKGKYFRDADGVHHMTFCSPLNKGEKGAAYGVVHAWGDRLEIRGPKIDDLLPNVQQRPPAAPCESDALDAPEPCERITLPLRKPKPKAS